MLREMDEDDVKRESTQSSQSTVGPLGPTSNSGENSVDFDSSMSERAELEVMDQEKIRDICLLEVPGWDKYAGANRRNRIKIDQLCEGLSNQIFKVYVDTGSLAQTVSGQACLLALENTRDAVTCVLFRVYGTEVSRMYDPEQELYLYKLLAKYGIAPKCYADGQGWRIEEWHVATALLNKDMTNPSVLAQVAAQVGRFHKLGETQRDFPREVLEGDPNVARRLREWSAIAMDARFAGENERRFNSLGVDEMMAEAEWLPSFLLSENSNSKGNGLDKVLSHADVQENNILLTSYGLRLIDFEYSGMCYQAFDIANYFVECTIDYLHKQYPYYCVDPTKFPTQQDQRFFCAIYLSEYLEWRVLPDDARVDVLLRAVEKFTLASHLIWAFWGIVRCPAGDTSEEFDFLEYAQARWEMYKKAKSDLMKERTSKNSDTDAPREVSAGGGVAATVSSYVALGLQFASQ